MPRPSARQEGELEKVAEKDFGALGSERALLRVFRGGRGSGQGVGARKRILRGKIENLKEHSNISQMSKKRSHLLTFHLVLWLIRFYLGGGKEKETFSKKKMRNPL